MSTLLKIDKLSAWYGDTRVLNEVDIEIKKGEISKLLKNKIKKNEINVGEASNLLLTSFIKQI